MWEIGTKYRKKSGLSADEIERNQRRLAKIEAAEDAAAKQAKKEEQIAALSKQDPANSERGPPSYNNLLPPTASSSQRSASNNRAGGPSQRVYYSKPRSLSSTSAVVIQESDWDRSYYGGLAALWRPDIAYREARDWHRRGMGEAGPSRMVPRDHPVYDMDPKERARLERIGIDPVAAAEMKMMSG